MQVTAEAFDDMSDSKLKQLLANKLSMQSSCTGQDKIDLEGDIEEIKQVMADRKERGLEVTDYIKRFKR